ncbi:MAG: DUF4870 domain-containing protein [Chloroflexota bacterium]
METKVTSQEERVLAGLAHGSILLGVFTNGIGGIAAALVVWVTQKDRSAYAAGQALQALVYQIATMVLTWVLWACWGCAWMALLLPPLMANPDVYQTTPPAGLWFGLFLMILPLGIMGLTVLYGLWGAVRCLGGHDFNYAVIGRWLENRK